MVQDAFRGLFGRCGGFPECWKSAGAVISMSFGVVVNGGDAWMRLPEAPAGLPACLIPTWGVRRAKARLRPLNVRIRRAGGPDYGEATARPRNRVRLASTTAHNLSLQMCQRVVRNGGTRYQLGRIRRRHFVLVLDRPARPIRAVAQVMGDEPPKVWAAAQPARAKDNRLRSMTLLLAVPPCRVGCPRQIGNH